ncbi:MAG: HAD family phosphatase [Eggerthellaceae bacterium]|nr:HAD family phosphatase [Eggerthellaceae bacterium]
MAKPRLIACDIDGTLLSAEQVELPRELASLIDRIVDAGIVFAPASGRQYAGLRTLFSEFGNRLSYVAENGAIAYVGDELVHRAALDRSLGEEIARTMLARPECELYVAGAETCYVKPKRSAYVDHLKNYLRFDVTEIHDIDEIAEPFLKVSAYHVALNPDCEFWEQKFGGQCNVVRASADWVDLTSPDASKASGVKAVCDRLGIDPADCIAFGDADNDAAMLDLVGHPIAMSWGSEAVRAAAVETTSSVAEVLARILEEAGA